MKDKKFIALSGLFFLIFFAGIAIITLEPATTILKAKNEAPSPLKSFAVVFPQVTTVGEKIKISVYMRDVNGSILSNRSVQLVSDPKTTDITPSDTQMTNNIGMSQFFISSKIPGKIQLTATDTVSNTSLVNIPSVEFSENK